MQAPDSTASNVIAFPLDRARARANGAAAAPVSELQIEQRETRGSLRASLRARGLEVPAWLDPLDAGAPLTDVQLEQRETRRLLSAAYRAQGLPEPVWPDPLAAIIQRCEEREARRHD
jgi:hypothetical protein